MNLRRFWNRRARRRAAECRLFADYMVANYGKPREK